MFKLMSVTILFLFFTNLDFFWIWYLQHLPKKLGEEHVFYCYLFSYNNKDWQIEDTDFLSLVGGIISHYYLELGRHLETHYASWIVVEVFFLVVVMTFRGTPDDLWRQWLGVIALNGWVIEACFYGCSMAWVTWSKKWYCLINFIAIQSCRDDWKAPPCFSAAF